MNSPTNFTNSDAFARERVLEHAAVALFRIREEAVELETIARQAEVDYAQAQRIFGDRDGLLQALQEHLNARFMFFIDREQSRLRAEATAHEKLRSTLYAYFCFSLEEPDNFGAFIALGSVFDIHEPDSTVGELTPKPAFQQVVNRVSDLLRAAGGPRDKYSAIILAYTLFGTVHGFAHLCTYGISRHLSLVARKQTLNAMLDTLCVGVGPIFITGVTRSVDPATPPAPMSMPGPKELNELPRDTDADKVECIFRGGIRQMITHGRGKLTLATAAQTAGIGVAEANRLFDGDSAFLAQLENYLDEGLRRSIDRQVQAADSPNQPLENLKAAGFGYMAHALADPDGFSALVQLASGTIVPSSRDIKGQRAGMGVAYGYLLERINEACERAFVDVSEWDIYVYTTTVWAACHGVTHLCAVGATRDVDEGLKHMALSAALDISILSVVESRGIYVPGMTITQFTTEQRRAYYKN